MDTRKLITQEMENTETALFEKSCVGVIDPMLMILKVHLLTEYYLERLIQVCLKRGDRVVSNGGFSYYQKLVLVDSFDVLDDSTIQCLKGLNKIRNKCSHEFNKEITVSDLEYIGQPLGKACTRYRIQSKNNTLIFLHTILSYLCGILGGLVAIHEKRILSEPDKQTIEKKKEPKSHGLENGKSFDGNGEQDA